MGFAIIQIPSRSLVINSIYLRRFEQIRYIIERPTMANTVKTCQSEASRKELLESISPTAARDLDGLSGWLWPVSWTGERKQQRNRFATLVSLQCVGYGGRGSARPTVWSFAQASCVMTTTFQQLDSDGLITRIREMSTNLLMARIQRRPSSRCCRAIIGLIWIRVAIITLPWLVVFR